MRVDPLCETSWTETSEEVIDVASVPRQEPQPIRAGSDLEALLPQLADASGLIVS